MYELGEIYHLAIIIYKALAVLCALQMYKENKFLVFSGFHSALCIFI